MYADLTYEGRANQLYSLYAEAKRLVEDLSRSRLAMSGSPQDEHQQQAAVTAAAESQASAETVGPLMLATGSLLSSALFEVSPPRERSRTH